MSPDESERFDPRAHWERVYTSKRSDEMSWYEPTPATSLRLLDAVATPENSVIDIGGGDSSLVDRLLDREYRQIAVLDVSRAALTRAQLRLGSRQHLVRWVEADVLGEWSAGPVEIWHDRAVFHFMTDPGDRARYLSHLRRQLVSGGHAIIATFGPEAPPKCSGLPVVRYSPDALAQEIGAGFTKVDALADIHYTPSGAAQQFSWVTLRRP